MRAIHKSLQQFSELYLVHLQSKPAVVPSTIDKTCRRFYPSDDGQPWSTMRQQVGGDSCLIQGLCSTEEDNDPRKVAKDLGRLLLTASHQSKNRGRTA
jgi:hypothetical protein